MRTPRLASRMDALARSDIRRMTLECERVGGINLGQGICDLPTIPLLRDHLARAVAENRSTYSRYDGIEPLRREIARREREKNGVDYDPEREVVVTVGATGAFALACLALLEAGEEVLLPEPFYGYHYNTVVAAGGVPVPVPSTSDDFAVDPGALRRAITPRTRAVVVCTPANPSGRVWSADELDALVPLLEEHDLLAITDEIYEDIVYDGRSHVSLASRPGARERTLTVSGFSKTFSITGWRLGFVAAPAAFAAPLGVLNDLFYVCAPTPLQHAVAGALAEVPDSYYRDLRVDYQDKRDLLVGATERLGWKPHAPAGAYYLMVEPSLADTARAAADRLLAEAGVASVPGSAFHADGGGEHLLRFCFAKPREDLEKAVRQLEETYGNP